MRTFVRGSTPSQNYHKTITKKKTGFFCPSENTVICAYYTIKFCTSQVKDIIKRKKNMPNNLSFQQSFNNLSTGFQQFFLKKNFKKWNFIFVFIKSCLRLNDVVFREWKIKIRNFCSQFGNKFSTLSTLKIAFSKLRKFGDKGVCWKLFYREYIFSVELRFFCAICQSERSFWKCINCV